MATYLRTSAQVPTPLAPAAISAVGDGSTGAFASGMVVGVTNLLNIALAKASVAAQAGSSGYGVISGLDLSTPGTLNVALSAGIAAMDSVMELVATVTFAGGQVMIPAPITLPDASISFVWLTNTGGMASTTVVGTPPAGARVFLGTVTTAGGLVTAFDYSGRVSIVDGLRVRQTADTLAPVDTPASGVRVLTNTLGGSFLWNGTTHAHLIDRTKHLPATTNVATLVADIALTVYSPNFQWLIASGATRVVTLPDPTLMPVGCQFVITNAGDPTIGAQNYNLTVKNFAGSLLASVSPGMKVTAGVQPPNGGSNKWPASLTPATAGS